MRELNSTHEFNLNQIVASMVNFYKANNYWPAESTNSMRYIIKYSRKEFNINRKDLIVMAKKEIKKTSEMQTYLPCRLEDPFYYRECLHGDKCCEAHRCPIAKFKKRRWEEAWKSC